MKEEDLIKKLEEISLPEIEIKSHKDRLKLALMERYFPERRRAELFNVFRKLAPVGVIAVLLFFFIFNNLNSPQRNLAKAKEIALGNTEIKNWIEQGATIKDVQIVNGRAYILIEPAAIEISEIGKEEETALDNLEATGIASKGSKEKEEFKGALAEVNIKEKKISKIESLTPTVTNLIEAQKEKTKEIADKSPEIQKSIPKEAEVLNIEVPTPTFKLIQKEDSFVASPEPEKEEASIIYRSDGNRWEGKVNLTNGAVEEIKFFGEVIDSATSEESDR